MISNNPWVGFAIAESLNVLVFVWLWFYLRPASGVNPVRRRQGKTRTDQPAASEPRQGA